MPNIRIVALLSLLSVFGCSKAKQSHTEFLPVTAERVSLIADVIEDTRSESDYVFFRSWNGRWIGTDCDTEIELHPNGIAVLIEYGYAVNKYDGTYSVNELSNNDNNESELCLTFPEYEGEWPPMAVYREGSDLLLIPTDSSLGFAFGNRSGATIPGGSGSFWPFRQVPIPE